MTEKIDLDDMETADEQTDEAETPTRGNWFWRGEGDPDDEPGESPWRGTDRDEDEEGDGDGVVDEPTPDVAADDADQAPGDVGDRASETDTGSEPDRAPVPHVPSENAGTPAGIPVSRGGGGAGEASDAGSATPGETETEAEAADSRASGPHGGGADDMTTAFTYRAARRLADPTAAFAEAEQWSDWIGVVGDVEAHVLGAFQREHTVDADFFNGSGTGPVERLAGIDVHSMFYADRMVVVGMEGEDEAVAEEAGWEFVPLTEAAAGAGWELTPADDDIDSESEDRAGTDT